MPLYVLSKTPQHEDSYVVHDRFSGCKELPTPEQQIDLDYHPVSHSALLQAHQTLPAGTHRIVACPLCCQEYYTQGLPVFFHHGPRDGTP